MYGIGDKLKIFPALLLSLLGAVPGIIVWTLVASFGEFASIVSALIPIGVFGGYLLRLFCEGTTKITGIAGNDHFRSAFPHIVSE